MFYPTLACLLLVVRVQCDDTSVAINAVTRDTIFATVVQRHGARTPIVIFPNDVNRDDPVWRELGQEQITNEGKKQTYQLGKFLRQRYSQLLPELYNKKDIYVYSTDIDRTLMSAECAMAGLYPPKGHQVWSPELSNWQPIPIHTTKAEDDNGVRGTKPCAALDYETNRVQNSDKFRAYKKSYKTLAQFLTKKLNYPIETLLDLEHVNDNLKIARENGLKWPEWVTNDLFEEINHWAYISMTSSTVTVKQQRLKLGVFFYEIISHFKSKMAGNLTESMWVYSAHDVTILNMLQAMKMLHAHFPPYAAALLIDLRKINGNFGVSMYYRNSTTTDPVLLKLPTCDYICEVGMFEEILKPVTVSPQQWESECKLSILQKVLN